MLNPSLFPKNLFIRGHRKLYSQISPLVANKNSILQTRNHFATEVKPSGSQRQKFEGAEVFDNPQGRFLSIEKDSYGSYSQALDLVHLRDSCSCSRCVNPSSGQKQFETAAIPLEIDVLQVKRIGDSLVKIRWTEDVPGYEDHVTTLPVDLWDCDSNASRQHMPIFKDRNLEPWTKSSLLSKGTDLNFDFSDYMKSDKTLHRLLRCIYELGIAFVHKMPSDTTAVKSVANRIGPLMNTFYGETWDVRSRPSAKNVAYTSSHLGFHMDLLYMKDPPHLQFLHCINQSIEGGESLFSDSLNAVYGIQRQRPDLAPCMWNFPVTYRYMKEGKYYQYMRPMIEGPGMNGADDRFLKWSQNQESSRADGLSRSQPALTWGLHIDAVNWAPPFQGPFVNVIGNSSTATDSKSSLRNYVKMSKLFRSIIEAHENVFETKMKEGTCVIFDNRRIVHARKAFANNAEERLLRGAYVDSNSFLSRLRALEAGLHDFRPTVLNE